MKRFLFTSGILLAAGFFSIAQAQNGGQFQDDIYGGSAPVQRQERSSGSRQNQDAYDSRADQAPAYRDEQQSPSSSGTTSQWGNTREYQDQYPDNGQDSYSDYNYDDDYYYATRLNRFYYPFYNRPYWSSFYDPYWYNPYWSDPSWGWNPWYSGMSISFGYGPFWNSYWGWNSWYGCPYFNSYYSYPYGGYGGYYSGYWNGYYAGLYSQHGDNYFPRTNVTYGPRYNLRPTALNSISGNAGGINTFRTSTFARPTPGTAANPGRYNSGRPDAAPVENRGAISRSNAATLPARMDDRPVRNGWSETPAVRPDGASPAAPSRWGSEDYAPGRQQQPGTPQQTQEMNLPTSPAPGRFSRPQPVPRNEQMAPDRGFERPNESPRGGGAIERGGGFNRGGGFERSGGGGHFGGNSGGGRGGFGGGGHRR